MEPHVARFVHLHQVDHQRRDDARHQGQDVREQRPHLIIGRPAGAVALWVVALRAALLAVARLAIALRVGLAVALRAGLAVALRAVVAVALRAVLRVSGVVHGARRLSSGRGGPSAGATGQNDVARWRAQAPGPAAGTARPTGTGGVTSAGWWPATPAPRVRQTRG